MSWPTFVSDVVSVGKGVAESRRFGIEILNIRSGVRVIDNSRVLEALSSVDHDLAVVRYPSGTTQIGADLAATGRKIIVTDSIVYWASRGLPLPEPLATSVVVEQVDVGSLESLLKVVSSSFTGYRSHWHFNPLTASIDMVDAYQEWVSSVISLPEHFCFLMRTHPGGEPCGMALVTDHQGVIEILLAGIASAFQGKRLYGALVSEVERFAFTRGAERVVISTQSSNINVQRAWTAQGWLPAFTVQCLHVIAP